jgi:tellurite resistance protein TehA-like permease
MISFRLRLAAAVAAIAIFTAACYVLVRAQRPIAAVLFAPAALLCLPLFASNRPPRLEEWPALNENVARFRTAGLICFTMAILLHTSTMTMRLGGPASGRVAAFGVAWWAVGFGLVPVTMYFASRRAMLEDDSVD